jgi:hypothetical protein
MKGDATGAVHDKGASSQRRTLKKKKEKKTNQKRQKKKRWQRRVSSVGDNASQNETRGDIALCHVPEPGREGVCPKARQGRGHVMSKSEVRERVRPRAKRGRGHVRERGVSGVNGKGWRCIAEEDWKDTGSKKKDWRKVGNRLREFHRVSTHHKVNRGNFPRWRHSL